MRALDLYCGAGGAAMGLKRAGFDEIVGVDIRKQPHYPFTFIHADALTFPLAGFDFIWASPPCQAHTWAAKQHVNQKGYTYADCLRPTQIRLYEQVTPYVIENVPLAPLRNPITLCGLMFGLRVVRHRLFEYGRFDIDHIPDHPNCRNAVKSGYAITAAGHGGGIKHGRSTKIEDLQFAMGIDWMNKEEINEAVPPAYSEFIARQFLIQVST